MGVSHSKVLNRAEHQRQIQDYAKIFPEYQIFAAALAEVLSAACRAALPAGIRVCRQHALNGTEMPYACFTAGRLHLLLDDWRGAMLSYSRGICGTPRSAAAKRRRQPVDQAANRGQGHRAGWLEPASTNRMRATEGVKLTPWTTDTQCQVY